MVAEFGFKRNATRWGSPVCAMFGHLGTIVRNFGQHCQLESTLCNLILVEHRKTDLLMCCMPRFLTMEDFAPFGQVFGNFGQHFQFQSSFVTDHCTALQYMTDLLMFLMLKFIKLKASAPFGQLTAILAPFFVTLVNMDKLT